MKPDILIVDDVADNLKVLSRTLKELGYKVRSANNGVTALDVAQKVVPDLILLDIRMPKMDGYTVCRQLKANSVTQHIPIIFLSALDDIFDKVKAFEVGGIDYINKPFKVAEVLARVKNQLSLKRAKEEIIQLNQKLIQLNQQLEQKVQERTKELLIKNQQLELTNRELMKEIEARLKAEEKLLKDAWYDPLTNLPNRSFLIKKTEISLQKNIDNPQENFALLFIDIDRFQIINDSYGQNIGDGVLVEFSKLLAQNVQSQDVLARLGGDEFAILLNNINDYNYAHQVAERINQQLKSSLKSCDRLFFISVSIGIAHSSTNYKKAFQILRDADIAMYKAKEKGKSCYEVFNEQMYLETLRNIELEHDLRLALKQNQLHLSYQPIVCLQHNSLVGFEALIRWQHPDQGFISPEEFIPLAEKIGLIIPLSNWILEEACQQLNIWQHQFSNHPNINSLTMSVNVSSLHLQEPNFLEELDLVLEKTNLDPKCLKLEITERALVDSRQNTKNILTEIKQRDIELSIDDFGTGYSSLSYLHRFPIDNLKIDRSFIDRLDSYDESYELVKTIIILGHNLKMKVIAEGIETHEQLEHLKSMSCEYAQGYFFAKPLSVKDIEIRFLQNNSQ